MNISKVKTAKKVADIVRRNDQSKNTIKMKWSDDVPAEVLKDESGRVYLIVSDGEIKKIGGSQCKGGIKTTFSFYCGGRNGSPSVRTYGIQVLITEELDAGKEVELYMIQSPKVMTTVSGLFGTEEVEVSAFKEMESKCVEEYTSITGSFPDWNFQESGSLWPQYIQEGCREVNNKY